jgi:hypothetical protein
MPEWAVALMTAAVTFASTLWTMHAKVRRDLEAEYDKDLRERRLTAYASLWALTEPLALYSPPEPLSPDGARALSERLRAWYFREGMVLSVAARDAYFALQDKLTADRIACASAPAKPLGESVVKELRETSSAMRSVLSSDVASRRPPMIASDDRER